jgi:hypothetical protein
MITLNAGDAFSEAVWDGIALGDDDNSVLEVTYGYDGTADNHVICDDDLLLCFPSIR